MLQRYATECPQRILQPLGKQDFAYLADEDVYRCPAGEKLTYRYSNIENGQPLRRYWTNACGSCVLKTACTTRRETVEHPFGTIKARMGATHFLTRTLPASHGVRIGIETLLHGFEHMLILGPRNAPLLATLGAVCSTSRHPGARAFWCTLLAARE